MLALECCSRAAQLGACERSPEQAWLNAWIHGLLVVAMGAEGQR